MSDSNPSSQSDASGKDAVNTSSNKNRSKQQNRNKKQDRTFEGSTSAFNGLTFSCKGEFSKCDSWRKVLATAKVYCLSTYSDSSRLMISLFEDDPVQPSVPDPPPISQADSINTVKAGLFVEEMKRVLVRREKLTNNLFSFFEVLFGQCSPGVTNKLTGNLDFDIKRSEGDCAWLLSAIRQIMFDVSDSKYRFATSHDAKMAVYNMRQNDGEQLVEYRYRYIDAISAATHIGVEFGSDPGLLKFVQTHPKFVEMIPDRPVPPTRPPVPTESDIDEIEIADLEAETSRLIGPALEGEDDPKTREDYTLYALEQYAADLKEYDAKYEEFTVSMNDYEKRLKRVVSNAYLAMVFVRQSDRRVFGSYIDRLQDAYLDGQFIYPLTIEDALVVLTEKSAAASKNKNKGGRNRTKGNGTNGKDEGNGDPPKQLMQSEVFPDKPESTVPGKSAPKTSTTSVTQSKVPSDDPPTDAPSPSLLPIPAAVGNNELVNGTNKEADIDLDGDDGRFAVSYATLPTSKFLLSLLLDTGSTINNVNDASLLSNIVDCAPKLVQGISGKHAYHKVGDFFGRFRVYYDPKSPANILSLATLERIARVTYDSVRDPAFVATFPDGRIWRFERTDDGLFCFTTEDVNLLKPSVTDYCLISTVEQNESKFHRREVLAATKAGDLYRKLGWPSQQKLVKLIATNSIRNCPVTVADVNRFFTIYGPDAAIYKGKNKSRVLPVPPPEILHIPQHIFDNHQHVSLGIDVLYVQSIPFFHTISDKIKFRTVTRIRDRLQPTLQTSIVEVIQLYHARGFKVVSIRGDGEFKFMEQSLPGIHFEPCPADAHVPDVERSNQTIKADIRTHSHALPFTRVPALFVAELVAFAVRCRNQVPHDDGVSDSLSPLSIVTGAPPVDANKLTLEFGSYCQAFNKTNPTNSQLSRAISSIAMNPCHNAKGDYYFLNLETGRRIYRQQYNVLPLTKAVIDQVEYLGLKQKMPKLRDGHFIFERRPGVPLDDTTLAAEAADMLQYGDDGDDADFVDSEPQSDLPAAPTASVRPSEVADLLADAADFAPSNATRIPPVPPVTVQGATDLPVPPSADANNDPVPVATNTDAGAEVSNDIETGDEAVLDDDEDPVVEENKAAFSDDDFTLVENEIEDGVDDVDDDDFTVIDNEPADTTSSTEEDKEISVPPDIEGIDDVETLVQNRSVEQNRSVGQNRSDEGDSDVGDESTGSQEERATNGDNVDGAENDAHRDRSNHRYGFRRTVNKPDFKQKFDNPISSKSYGTTQFLQRCVKEISNDPQKLHNALCDVYERLVEVCFTQMSAKAGIKKHGDKAIMALFSEFAQLHDKKVMKAIRASDLTRDQRKHALHAINVIKEKRDGKIKGRTCADGRKQRGLYTKEQTASPTISNDAFFALLCISAAERRKIVSWDVEGAYLLADQDDFVLLKFVGESVDIMCKVDNKYTAYVSYENGKKVLYLQLLKALYGTLRAALLWYELYVTKLQALGFELNPYDLCVANKQVNGKQCSVGWYVDDNFASHDDQKVLDELLDSVRETVGAITCTTGSTHDFLGMNITFNDDGTAHVKMREYVQACIDAFPGELRKQCNTPARTDLFTVKRHSNPLPKDQADTFRSIVMKIMYLGQRCRLDLQTALAFLCTRVDKPTEEDWEKLRRLISYMNNTKDLYLTIGAENLDELLSFTDVSFAVHEDMKSHTGGCTSFGRGFFMTRSTKQKMNAGSTTESEVIGAAEYLPNTIWLMRFLEAQGHKVSYSTFYQDNESAIKLEKFGKRSSSRRSRHFDIKLFNIKDKVKANNIDITFCPTDLMVADYFTKALQGSTFRRMRDLILGIEPLSSIQLPSRGQVASKERVGQIVAEDNVEAASASGRRKSYL